MDKRAAKQLGAWISLLGGSCFVLGALAAAYVAFWMKPATAFHTLGWLGHRVNNLLTWP